MYNYWIANRKELDAFMRKAARNGHSLKSIRGPAPADATYDDGTAIVRSINVGWRNENTGETFDIVYEKIPD